MRHALLALLLAATACTSSGGAVKPTPLETETTPAIATDACPSAGALLTKPANDGDRLPDVTLPCIGHDGTVAMRALGGIPYVVNLWGSWCFPCRTEMPEFQKVYADYKGRVGFLGVDTQDFDKPARAAIQRAGISYPSVFDKDSKVKLALGTRSLPTTVLVGADGRIKDVHVGELTGAELRANITKYLGVAPATPLAARLPYVVTVGEAWCYPCRAQAADLDRAAASYDGRVDFVGVGTGNALVRSLALPARRLPVTALVGADGRVRKVHVGTLDDAALRADIARYLGVS